MQVAVAEKLETGPEAFAQWAGKHFPSRRIDRVLLVCPPDADREMFQYDTAKRGRYVNYPPYGLAIIAQNLREIGVEVEICNLNHEVLKACRSSRSPAEFDFDATWQSALDAAIDRLRPDLVGVTCMFTMTHVAFRQVCAHIGKRKIPLAIGGVHVTNDANRVLDDVPDASIVFLREGDRAVRLLVEAVRGRANVADLGQVILVDGASRIRLNKEVMPTAEEIDLQPAFDLLELKSYSDFGPVGSFYFLKSEGTRFATALSNRGCRAQCTFCSVRNFNGKGVRQRSVSAVVDELEMLRDDYGVGHFMWLDDDLLMDRTRTMTLFNEMVRRKLSLTWDASNGVIAASCTEEVVAAAVESGCIALNIGMETGSREMLRRIRKPGNVEKFLRAAEVFRKHENLHANVFLMLGFPGETMRMIQETIDVARKMDLDWYRIMPLQPLPNTPIYDSMVTQGILRPVGQQNVRYQIGPYGRHLEIERASDMSNPVANRAFASIGLDEVPTSEQVTDIWFYMNYHLNFHRIFHETRRPKLNQLLLLLRNISDKVAPEHGFAIYFLGVLEKRLYGRVDPDTIGRLRRRLAASPYWEERFRSFGLSADDLEKADIVETPITPLSAEPAQQNVRAQ